MKVPASSFLVATLLVTTAPGVQAFFFPDFVFDFIFCVLVPLLTFGLVTPRDSCSSGAGPVPVPSSMPSSMPSTSVMPSSTPSGTAIGGWVRGAAGASCTATCTDPAAPCDPNPGAAVTTPATFNFVASQTGSVISCLATDNVQNDVEPSVLSAQCRFDATGPVNDCDNSFTNIQRICCCGNDLGCPVEPVE